MYLILINKDVQNMVSVMSSVPHSMVRGPKLFVNTNDIVVDINNTTVLTMDRTLENKTVETYVVSISAFV